MFDMRCEEEATVQPHSRARQEQLQLINSQLREEDDKWQDVSAGATAGQWRDRSARWARGPLEQRIRIRLGGSLGLESHAEERGARRRLQTVNTAHVGIKGSLLKFGQKAEGSGREATSMGCQIKDELSSEFVYLELIMMMMMTTMITANIESVPVTGTVLNALQLIVLEPSQ